MIRIGAKCIASIIKQFSYLEFQTQLSTDRQILTHYVNGIPHRHCDIMVVVGRSNQLQTVNMVSTSTKL